VHRARAGDLVFAAGIAVGVVRADGTLAVVRELCSRHVAAIPRVPGESWAECWHRNDYEERCFAEFWGRAENIAVLEQLQAMVNCTDVEEETRRTVHAVEAAARAHGCSLSWYTDSALYDAFWLNRVVLDAGEQPLLYYRTGAYGLDVIDLFSSFVGAVAAVTGEPVYRATERSRAARELMRSRAKRDCPDTHDPADDALHIVAEFYHLAAAVRETYRVLSPVAVATAAGGDVATESQMFVFVTTPTAQKAATAAQ